MLGSSLLAAVAPQKSARFGQTTQPWMLPCLGTMDLSLGALRIAGLPCGINPMKSKTLAHEWFEEVWNKSQINAIDRLLADDAVAHGLFDEHGQELRGPAGFKPFFLQFTKAFPDIHVEVADTISEGDKIAARCVVTGTHKGDMLGVSASNRPIEFTGIAIIRVKDGRIVEAWNNFDFQALSKQIGSPT